MERSVGNQFSHPEIQKRASRFLTDKTKAFAVNGTGIPEVNFDVGTFSRSGCVSNSMVAC